MPSPHSSEHDSFPTTTRLSSYAVSAPKEHLTSARANAPSASGAPLPNRKKGRASKTEAGKHLSKSFSTPQLRGPIMSESELDKKRNKLGYQRISIACAHCRRRKIRCLLAEDDSEQRCQNCIRLKKECVFYPVDQQAALDARSEASSRTGGEPSAPSSAVSTSPPHLSARTFDQQNHQYGGSYHHMPADASGGYGLPIAPTAALPSQGGYVPHQSYSYEPHREPSAAWNDQHQQMGSHAQLTPISTTSSIPPPFARYETASHVGDTAPFPGSSDQQSPAVQRHPPGYSYTPEPMQQQWPPPQQPVQQTAHRSMSYPDYPNQIPYPQGYPPTQNHQQPHAFMQQPPLQPHQSDPRAMAIPSQTLPSSGHHYTYQVPPDQRSSSIPAVAAYQPPPTQMQQNWYPDGGYGSGSQDGRGHDPTSQGSYARRPA